MKSLQVSICVVVCLTNVFVNCEQTVDLSFNDLSLHEKIFNEKPKECLKQYLNADVLAEEFHTAYENDDLQGFMKNNCPKWRSSIECYDTYVKELDEHLGFIGSTIVNIFRRLILSSVDYFCENSGERLLDFINHEGLECLHNNQEVFKQCLTSEFGDDFINIVSIDKNTNVDIEWSPTSFSTNSCRLIRNSTECLLSVIQESCTNFTFEFFNNYVNGVLKETPCWGLVGEMSLSGWEQYLMAILVPRHIPTKERICSNNLTGFEMAEIGITNASRCWNSYLDNAFMLEDAAAAIQDRGYFRFLKKYCPKLKDVTTCVDGYLNSFQVCTESKEELMTLEATGDILQGVTNFVCHRDGERILLFMKEDGIQCLKNKTDEIVDCVEGAGVTELFQGKGNVSDIKAVLNNLWIPQNYRPQECKVMVALEVCAHRIMRTCSDRTPANLMSSLIRSVARKSPCWSDIKHQYSGSTRMDVLSWMAALFLTVLCFTRA